LPRETLITALFAPHQPGVACIFALHNGFSAVVQLKKQSGQPKMWPGAMTATSTSTGDCSGPDVIFTIRRMCLALTNRVIEPGHVTYPLAGHEMIRQQTRAGHTKIGIDATYKRSAANTANESIMPEWM